MPQFTSYPAGTPSWVDHATKDLDASNSFYGTLFGWEADDQGEDMGHYTIMRKGGKTVAGNMKAMMEGQPSAWVSYISVADADATIELAKKAGAIVFDNGNLIRTQAKAGGVANAFDIPIFSEAFLRPLFARAIGPFRWMALSNDPMTLPRSMVSCSSGLAQITS